VSEFVDANLFVRFLTQDDRTKARNVGELFQRAEAGEFDLVTSEAIVAEVVYVLSSDELYRRTRQEIATALGFLLRTRAIRIDHKQSVLDALDLYQTTRLDFEDCLATAHAVRETDGRVFSYDKGFGRISGITRLEPAFDPALPDQTG
jgi:predicted nucleic-acid-binding protein